MKLTQLDNFVGEKDTFLSQISFIDIQFAHFFTYLSIVIKKFKNGEYLSDLKNLHRVQDHIYNIKEIKEVRESKEGKERIFLPHQITKLPKEFFE